MRTKSLQSVLVTAILLAASTLAAAATPAATSQRYQVHGAPFAALQQAAALVTPDQQPVISEPEFDLFQQASAGNASTWTMADAALVSAGVTDETERQFYLNKFDQIAEEARQVTADAETPSAKAKVLASYLREGPLHGGYVDGQIDICRVLDDGTYQCVSSAILFDIIGRRIGLNSVPVTMPGHVCIRISNFFVEPTSGRVYSAAAHEKIVDNHHIKHEQTAELFGDQRTYESNNLGLIAEVYYDRGNSLAKEKQYDYAVVNYLKEACLDPLNPILGHSLDIAMRNWFKVTMQQKQFNKARSIASLYRQVLGDPKTTNRMFQELTAANQGPARATAQFASGQARQ